MTAQVPFPDAQQLNNQLNLNINENSVTLTRSDIAHDTLPGQARVLLNGSELDGYVRREHSTPELDTLAPWLWLVLSNLNPDTKLPTATDSSRSRPLGAHISLHYITKLLVAEELWLWRIRNCISYGITIRSSSNHFPDIFSHMRSGNILNASLGTFSSQ